MGQEKQLDFSEDETLHLEKILLKRNKLIEKLEEKEEGLYNNDDVAKLYLSALKDQESHIFNKAKIRTKSENDRNKTDVLDIIANVFMKTKANLEKQPDRIEPITLDEKFVVDNLVPGEMDEISFRILPNDIT